LGYGEVFWKTLSLQWGVFAAFAAATFLILYGSFLALKRAHLSDLPNGHTILIGGRPVKLPVEPVLRLIALGVSLAIAAATGAGMMAEWPTLALFWYAPRTTAGVVDPIFGKPLNFFLFALPAWQLVAGWLLTLAVVTCLLAAFFVLITGGSRVLAGRLSRHVTLPWRGLSMTSAFLLLILAVRVYIGRFERLLDDHTIFGGVTYTDAHVTLAGMLVWEFAMWSGSVPTQRNPMELVTIKGASKRTGKPRSLTVEEFQRFVHNLGQPFRTISLVCVCFGLRISEALALEWCDVDWLNGKLSVERGIVRQRVDDLKTETSHMAITVTEPMIEALKTWKQTAQFSAQEDWIFASPAQLAEVRHGTAGFSDF
jgi:hypothetical protein